MKPFTAEELAGCEAALTEAERVNASLPVPGQAGRHIRERRYLATIRELQRQMTLLIARHAGAGMVGDE